jgi:hypothetical protein
MTLTDEQQFLLAANTVAAVHDYFHWRVVGSALKWPEMKSVRMLRVLNEQLLVAAQRGEEARLLPAGRQLAQQLLAMDKQEQPSGRK